MILLRTNDLLKLHLKGFNQRSDKHRPTCQKETQTVCLRHRDTTVTYIILRIGVRVDPFGLLGEASSRAIGQSHYLRRPQPGPP